MAKRTVHAHSAGPGGSPFPPLGLAASGAAGLASASALGTGQHIVGNSTSRTGASSSLSNVNGDAFHAHPPSSYHHGHHHHQHQHHHHHQKEGLPPAPSKVDAVAAQQCRLQDAYWSDDEEDMECPLCLEEIDLSDANFKPCPCGYQICRFCWHHIKSNLNGRCPACRRKYSDQAVEFKPMSADEIKRLTQAKKQKEREKKELENMNRKHLANMRVVQKNLVYVVGLSSKLAKEELIPTLRSNEYFGQYGRISKILISKRTTASKLVMGTSESNIGVYVTYHRKEDAARAIVAIDGSKGRDGKILRASYGTTKYCTTYLRNLPCTNPACTYLHEPGEEADSFTKEDLSTLRHAARDLENKTKPSGLPPAGPSASAQFPPKALTSAGQTSVGAMTSVDSSSLSEEASALPKTASWASGKPGSTAPAPLGTNGLSGVLDDSDMPPLSANILKKPTTANKIAKQTAGATLSARTVQTPTSFKAKMAGSSSQPTNNSVAVKNPVRDGSSVGSPALTVPPGLSQMADASQRPATPSAPPGLTKPLGLAPPLTAPPPSSTPVSNYQPSPSAQAILDDIRSRREAEPEQPQPSPFPDFEYTLSRFSDGDFSFNFLGVRSDDKTTGAVVNGDSLGAFAPFSAIFDESPHLSRAPSHAAATMYSGSFDPFSGEEVSLGGVKRIDSPFKALEEMRRSLSEERAAAGHDRGGGQQQDAVLEGNEADDANNRASRFDFAKGAPQARSDRLLRTDMYNDQDPLALSRDVSGILGNVFDNEPNSISSGSSGLYRETKIYGRATQAQAQAAQQAAQAQFQAQAQHAIIAQQQRAIVGPPGLLSFGGASSQQSSNSNWYYELQQQRQQQVQANGYGGYSATGAGAAATPPTASSEPLLAQIMAATGGARSSVFGATVGALGGPSGQQVPGSASDGHSFFDPAMLSMRGQGQGHQQLPSLPQLGGFSSFDHQQHHGNASYVGPGGASTSPAAGVFHRSPYSTMS